MLGLLHEMAYIFRRTEPAYVHGVMGSPPCSPPDVLPFLRLWTARDPTPLDYLISPCSHPSYTSSAFSVLAPTNAAFASALGSGLLTEGQLQDPVFLKPLLENTLVPGQLKLADLEAAPSVDTLSGGLLPVTSSGPGLTPGATVGPGWFCPAACAQAGPPVAMWQAPWPCPPQGMWR